METAPKPKKRACDSCYRRKIQCDGEEPQCNWCLHHNLACTFHRPTRIKKASKQRRGAQDKGLSKRIERLENLLAEKVSQTDAQSEASPRHGQEASGVDSLASLGTSPGRLCDQPSEAGMAIGSFGKLHFAGRQLGEISSCNGVPLFSSDGRRWIQARTGQIVSFPRLDVPLWHNQQSRHDTIITPASNFDLPDRKVTEEYFSIFCLTAIRHVFPIVDVEVFNCTITAAYKAQGTIPALDHARAKACVLSFLSIVSIMEPAVEASPIDSDACALKAQYLLPQIVVEANIDALQVALMQCMFNLFSGNLQTAVMFHSLACRMMFMLGGHVQAIDLRFETHTNEDPDSWRVKQHLRKYFWMCYSFDKDIALRTGQPPAVPDEYCDLTLPCNYAEGNHDSLRLDASGNPFLPGDLRLSIIKSKSLRLLYSTQAFQKTDAQLLRDIRELDDELEEWRVSLQPASRPTLSCRAEDCVVDPDTSLTEKMHRIITNFEYHYLVATIHQATSRCRSWYNVENGEMEGVSSSLALSVAASRSTLNYLRSAVQALAGEAFWMIIFYPMSAVLTIFCNILQNPLSAQALDDLELLGAAPQLIKNIRIRRLTVNEIIHIKKIEDFISELIRLGSCAIRKAQQERQAQASPFGM